MFDITMLVCAVLGVLITAVGLLPQLGVDIRIWGRSATVKPLRVPWLSILILIVSTSLSAAAFYYFFRPRILEKIVEKPVDRIVEKSVLVPCPKSTQSVTHAGGTAKALNSGPAPAQPTFSVTNPTDSIVNQDSPNYGQQTIVHNPPINPSKEVVTYDCGGSRHTYTAIPMNIGQTFPAEEAAAFQKLGELTNSHQFRELKEFCDKQIAAKRDAEWLAPYVFRAYAEFELGDKETARQTLAYYDDHKGSGFDTGACKQASDFLHTNLK
jgi:hypothetical protein